jgi:hypothetical protein
MLFNRTVAPYAESFLNPIRAAASSFAVQAIAAPVGDLSELEAVVAAQAREPNGGLIVIPDSFTDVHHADIIALHLSGVVFRGRWKSPWLKPWDDGRAICPMTLGATRNGEARHATQHLSSPGLLETFRVPVGTGELFLQSRLGTVVIRSVSAFRKAAAPATSPL